MKQQEYATGATQVSGGTSDGRAGGAGRVAVTADAAVRAHRPDAPQDEPAADLLLSPDPGLLRLAHWFAAADAELAHDLCAAALGLYPARHLGCTTEQPEEPAEAAVSWWHGPTAHDSAALRAREARPARGGVRRAARRDQTPPPAPARPGRHRKPERSRAVVPAQDRSAAEVSSTAADASSTAAERRIAARLLLAHPLVTAAGPHADGFPLIRRHRDWLVERFATLLGYRLVVGPWHARLCKAGLGPGGARRLEHPLTGAPFTPGAYAQLALALALLVDAPERVPQAALLAGLRRITATPGERAAALAALADWQVITDVRLPDPGAVLTVDRELARAVPAGPPALAEDAADLIRRAAEADPAVAVRRRLAETPAVLAADLTAEQRHRLHGHTDPAEVADFLGLEAEVRAEGVALLDPADELTDLALPGAGTPARAALLLVQRLVEELRPLPGEPPEADVAVPDALIDGVLGDIADEYGLPAGWRRDYLADRTALRRDTLDLLHRMGLITPNTTRPPSWLLRAPAARYAPAVQLAPTPGTGRHGRRG